STATSIRPFLILAGVRQPNVALVKGSLRRAMTPSLSTAMPSPSPACTRAWIWRAITDDAAALSDGCVRTQGPSLASGLGAGRLSACVRPVPPIALVRVGRYRWLECQSTGVPDPLFRRVGVGLSVDHPDGDARASAGLVGS